MQRTPAITSTSTDAVGIIPSRNCDPPPLSLPSVPQMATLEQARKEAREKLEQAEADYAAAMAPQIEALQDQARAAPALPTTVVACPSQRCLYRRLEGPMFSQ